MSDWAKMVSPMLANPGSVDDAALYQQRGWIADMKWDGVRCIAVYDKGEVSLLNRKGEDFAFRYPEVVRGVQDLVAATTRASQVILDGEIVIFDPATGRPQFGLTGQRAFGPGRIFDIRHAAETRPATLIAFDLLMHDIDLRHLRQVERWRILNQLIPTTFTGRVVQSVRSPDVATMLQMVRDQRLEGLIVKNPDAPYRAGRRSDWVKLKPTRSATVIVTGFEPGEGKRAETFGALRIAVTDDSGARVDLGKVGSGFSDEELAIINGVVKSGVEFLGEVEYLDRQPKTGVLRFPVWKGARFDVDTSAATSSQLPAIP